MQVVTEVGLLVLIWGTTMPGFAQVGEVLSHGIHALSPTAGGALLANDGQLVILLAAVTMIPVSWVHNMSEVLLPAVSRQAAAHGFLALVLWHGRSVTGTCSCAAPGNQASSQPIAQLSQVERCHPCVAAAERSGNGFRSAGGHVAGDGGLEIGGGRLACNSLRRISHCGLHHHS